MNHLSTFSGPMPIEIINNVDKCYRHHSREGRVKWSNKKLICYIQIGGNNRMMAILLVSKGLNRLLFDAYHAGGIDGHLGINKTILVLCLRFLWTNTQKTIIAWVRACADCMPMNNMTRILQHVVRSWPLLTPCTVISMDIWSPGDTVSPTGAKHMLKCMCNMSTFVVGVAVKHVSSSELSRVFMEKVLLKFGLCLVVLVNAGTAFMHIFVAIMKVLKIRLHTVAK